jgi:hypothetical protein
LRFFHDVAERYGLRVAAVIDTLQWWTVHLSTLDGDSGVLVATYYSRAGQWQAANGRSLDPGQVAAYLAVHGEDVSQSALAADADPYTDPGQARVEYHRAVRDYRALHETQAGRFLVQTLAGEKPRPDSNRPDAIALDAAYQAVRASWRKAFAGDAQDVAGRFAAWAQAASVMAGNLAAEKHRAGKFRAALDAFTVSAGRLASRTQATAMDSGAWARVFAGLPGSAQDAGQAPGVAAPGDVQPDTTTPTASPGPAPADETGTQPSGKEAADGCPAGPAAAPLANMDLAAELDRMPGAVFARWLSMAGTPPAAGDLDYRRPGAGSWATAGEDGIEVTVSGPDSTRHGLVTWPQAANWIDNGATPARLGLVIIADRLSTFCRTHRDQLIVAGTSDPDTAAAELRQIRDAAVAMIVNAAVRSRGAAKPVPPAGPGDPAWYTAVMITRPDLTAGKAENAALERLTQLRTAIRDPQPATATEIRAAIWRWTRYGGLPDLVRALDSPAAMRAWISDQVSSRREGGYDRSGERWHGASPDGLITDRNGDDRAPVLIRWEEIPAWIQPGITSSQRDRLLAADDGATAIARRRLTAAVHPNAGLTAPSEEEDEQAACRLTEATGAFWAAIEAAPPPSPADLDNARHVYRDTGPVQPALFDPRQDGTPAQDTTRATASRQPRPAPPPSAVTVGAERPAATTSALSAEDAPSQVSPAHPGTVHTPAAGPARQRPPGGDHPELDTAVKDQAASPSGADPARASGTPGQSPATAAAPVPAGAARTDEPGPPLTAATNSDLAIALHSMSDFELTSFLTQEKTPAGHGSLTSRRNGLPDAGASQMLNFDHGGIRITVTSRRSRRAGQVSWRQVASWIDVGLTPARLGIITGASQLGTFTNARRDQLITAGKGNIDAVIIELRKISNDAIAAALTAALAARDADAPVPPASRGKPVFRTTAMLTRPDPAATAEENAALARIAELESAIRGAQPPPAAGVKSTTVQASLFDDSGQGGQRDAEEQASMTTPSKPSASRAPAATPLPATAAPGSTPAEPGKQQDKPAPVTASAGKPPRRERRPALTAAPQPGPVVRALTTDDILTGLGHLPTLVIADLLTTTDATRPLKAGFHRVPPWSGERQPGEPDAGARETICAEPEGVRITVTVGRESRAGLVAWPEIAERLRAAANPRRCQIVVQATQVALRFAAGNSSFRAAGEGRLAAAAEGDLRSLAAAAVAAMLNDARSAAAGHAEHPARPVDESGALERISALAAALPGQRPQPRTPVSQVKAGDVIGHPGYKLQPFRVSAPPRLRDGEAQITGHLTEPAAGEPAGQVTFTLPATRNPDPVVLLIPLPRQSLRPLLSRGGDGPGQASRPGVAAPQPGHRLPASQGRHAHAAQPASQAGTAEEDASTAAVTSDGTERPGLSPEDITPPAKEDTMPPAPASPPRDPAATQSASGEAPAAPAPEPALAPDAASRARMPAQPGDGPDLAGELDRVLSAIIERRNAGRKDSSARDDFTDIRAAFTLLRAALDLGGTAGSTMGYSPHPAAQARGGTRPGRAAPEPASSLGGTGFGDIRAAFAGLRRVLDLPAGEDHAPGAAGQSASRLLDQAAEEAQACARWYQDTPEWQHITTIGRAAQGLIRTIKDAARDYWAEIRQDARVRGFARTLAARTCRAVAVMASSLADRLEHAGQRDSRAWRAAQGLHRATAAFADRIMRYTPPGRGDRMSDTRRIIDELGASQRTGPADADGARPGAGHAHDPVRLARSSFTAKAPRQALAPEADPARRAAPSAGRHRRVAHRS